MKKKMRKFHKNKVDFFETHQGQEEYDKELARIQENRRRYSSYLKAYSRSHCTTEEDRRD